MFNVKTTGTQMTTRKSLSLFLVPDLESMSEVIADTPSYNLTNKYPWYYDDTSRKPTSPWYICIISIIN